MASSEPSKKRGMEEVPPPIDPEEVPPSLPAEPEKVPLPPPAEPEEVKRPRLRRCRRPHQPR
jgi:hypothetical protein